LTPYLPVAAWWTFIALIELVLKAAGPVVMRNLRKTNPGAYKVILGLVGFSVLLFGLLVWALWRVENFYTGGLPQPPGGARRHPGAGHWPSPSPRTSTPTA
jgi:hypothetical protein